MFYKYTVNIKNLFAGSLFFLLCSCGGGSGNSATSDSDNTSRNSTALTGYIYYVGSENIEKHDMSTDLETPVIDSSGIRSVAVSDDSSNFVFLDAGMLDYIVRDAGMNEIYRRSTQGRYDSGFKFSPNNQFVLYNWKRGAGDYAIRIDDALGIQFSATFSGSGMDWVNDDEIIFANGSYIWKLKGLGLNGGNVGKPEALIQFSSGVSGDIALSPGGEQVAYRKSLSGGRSEDALFVFDLNSEEERQLTEYTGQLSSIDWSPDGNYLAVVEGSSSGGFINPDGTTNCPNIYIIPARGGIKSNLTASDSSPAIRLFRKDENGLSQEICTIDYYRINWRAN